MITPYKKIKIKKSKTQSLANKILNDKDIYIYIYKGKKNYIRPTWVKMKNLSPSRDTKVIVFESKLNRIIKFNYRTTQS